MDQQNLKKTKTCVKVFWAWQDEKEEQWLSQNASEGWHLVSVAPFFYEFQQGIPSQVIYRLDYKVTIDKDYQEYCDLFSDSRWELITTMSNWHYYRIEAGNDHIPDIYNSNRTRAQKYRRLLAGLFPVIFIFFVIMFPRITDLVEGREEVSIFYRAAYGLMALIMVFMAYAIIRIVVKIRHLESQSKE